MEHGTAWWIVGFATSVAGGLLTAASMRLLGRARAAANWPTALPTGRGARALAAAGAGFGLLLLAAGATVLVARLGRPAGLAGWLLPAGAGAALLLAGGLAAVRLAERAELSALIRTPSAVPWVPGQGHRPGLPAGPVKNDKAGSGAATLAGGTDPVVPPGGQPGWVYRDRGGDWYLALGAGPTGRRLVRLTDFALVPVGAVAAPLELAGSVQISVYPVEEPQPAA
jgi:hypothetical protein